MLKQKEEKRVRLCRSNAHIAKKSPFHRSPKFSRDPSKYRTPEIVEELVESDGINTAICVQDKLSQKPPLQEI